MRGFQHCLAIDSLAMRFRRGPAGNPSSAMNTIARRLEQ